MTKELLLLSDIPQFNELKVVFDKVKTNLEIIKTLSEETNELLKSVAANEINFSAEINCDHLFRTKNNGGQNSGSDSAICCKCGYELTS